MSRLVGLCCEDADHHRVLALLVGHPEDTSWVGREATEAWYRYRPDHAKSLPPRIGGRPVRLHGHIGGVPQKRDARKWREVLWIFGAREPRPDVVVLATDLDGEPTRREGMEQVRTLPWPFAVVLATPEPEVEAWIVAGFQPESEREHRVLDALRTELSFDPTKQPARLTSHPNDAPTDSKRVLDRLTDGDHDRQERCLRDVALLRERGTGTWIAAFLDEADESLRVRG